MTRAKAAVLIGFMVSTFVGYIALILAVPMNLPQMLTVLACVLTVVFVVMLYAGAFDKEEP